MSTTISQDSSTPAVDDYAHHIANFLASRPVKPITLFDIDGSALHFLFQHQVPDHGRDRAYRMMKHPDNCHTCAERFGLLHAVSDIDGSVWNCLDMIDPAYVHYADYEKMAAFAGSATNTPITGLVLLHQDTLLGHDMMVGGWNHIVRPVSADHRSTSPTDRTRLILDAIPRYVTSGLFDRFLTRLIPQGKDSLALMKTCLDKAAYGLKFIPAVDWCVSVLDDLATHTKPWQYFSPKEKVTFAVRHIIRAGLSKDLNGTVAMLFQTATGNIIGLLEDAKSEAAMTVMCQERLSPQNYQRPTADASQGQIENAVKHLGDFTNTVLTDVRAKELIPEIVCHGRSVTIQSDITSSMTGFSAQLAKAQAAKAPTPASFANRCGQSSLDVEIKKINTLRRFVEFARAHPELGVEISLDSSANFAYAAETTLSKEYIAHRHVWAFLTGRTKTEFGLYGSWAPVAMTLPMYEYIDGYKNCLFVIDGIKPGSSLGNCCFPEFLTSQYQRVCRTAFEGLNRTTKIVVPSGQLMLGIGSSVTDAYGKLYHPINLRVGGVPVTLLTL